jgi:hypothetical protein
MRIHLAQAWLLAFGALTLGSQLTGSGGFRAVAAEVAAPAVRHDGESIHRLGSDPRQLRFEGETSAKTWTVYVTAAQAQTRARIRLSYSNAISVMPEESTLAVSVNDISVAQTPIAAASDPGGLDVELPRGLLVAGYNMVRISVTQRHRVDCSLEATYELWTQLDPATSGLTYPGLVDAGIATLDDLAAISPDPSGAVTIRAVLPDEPDAASVDRMLKAVEAVAIRAGIVRPSVEIVKDVDARPGLWVLAGVKSDLRARGFDRWLTDADSPALAGLDAPGRVIVVASGADAKATDAAIAQILPKRGGDDRTSALTARPLAAVNGFPVTEDMRVPLHDLGVRTEEFNGRLFRAGVDIVMPPDFYPADYDKLTLSISAGYSAGLLPGAQILIRVNDLEAGSLPMRNPHGDLFQDRPISISLGALRPGVNRLVIEAQTPSKDDAACDVRTLMDAKKRFVLFDRSEIVVPSIARIARMPNLSGTLSSGFPYQSSAPAWIFLAGRDPATIGAAATFLARTAFVSGKLLNARPTFARADLLDGSVLFFGAMEDFNAGMFDEFGVDYHVLRESWSRPALADAVVPAPTKSVESAFGGSEGDIYDQWAKNARPAPTHFGTEFSATALYDRYINVHRSDFALLRAPAEIIKIPDSSTLLIAQTRGPGTGSDTWTLVVAANSKTLTRDIGGLVAPSNWNTIEGRAAVFGPKSGVENFTLSSNAYFIITKPLTPANLRLVAAGWLSSNIDYYVIAMMLGAFVLGVVTLWTVRAHGARQ